VGALQEYPQAIQTESFSGKRFSKWHALTIGLVVLVIVQALFSGFLLTKPQGNSEPSYEALYQDYLSLQSQLASLMSDYESLNSEYLALQASYDDLNASQKSDFESQYLALQSRYDELSSQYTSLNSQYSSLNASYDALDSSYDALDSSYTLLNSSYISLQAQFDELQTSYYTVASDYFEIRYQINQRSQHYDVESFITPNDTAVQQTIEMVTGGWSDPSDWDEYWTDLKALYNWVVNNIPYNYDGLFPVLPSVMSGDVEYTTEVWQFPNETLSVGRGDYEDMAILLCSLVRGYSHDYWAECILIASSSAGHAAVQIPVSGGKLAILDPAGHYYTSSLGNLVSKDITTEITSWLNYWKPQMGTDVRVYRVFSDYMDQTFTSTSAYTSWMYNR
jgi:prefoldin subunit 5